MNCLMLKGIIVEKVEVRPKPDGGTEEFYTFQVFNAMITFAI